MNKHAKTKALELLNNNWADAIVISLVYLAIIAVLNSIGVGFILFSGILFYRQQLIFRHILKRLKLLEEMIGQVGVQTSVQSEDINVVIKPQEVQKTQETRLSIMKDEPISKYESMTLPDDVQISFVEKDQ